MDPEYRKSQMLGVFHVLTCLTLLVGLIIPGWTVFIASVVLMVPMDGLRDFAAQERNVVSVEVIVGVWVVILVLAVLAALLMLALAIGVAMMATWTHKRKHYRFCLTLACLECLVLPHGTLFGIMTVLFLSRPEVRAQFFEPEADALGAYAPPLPAESVLPGAPGTLGE